MRKTAETDDVVAAAYKDQIAHYAKDMLETESKGERVPVIETLRMLGEPEFNVAQEIERVWDAEVSTQKEFVDKEHRVREFVAKKVGDYWEDQVKAWVGPERSQKVIDIQRGIHEGGPPPGSAATPAEEEKPAEATPALKKLLKRVEKPDEVATLEAMKQALEEKIAALKKEKK